MSRLKTGPLFFTRTMEQTGSTYYPRNNDRSKLDVCLCTLVKQHVLGRNFTMKYGVIFLSRGFRIDTNCAHHPYYQGKENQ